MTAEDTLVGSCGEVVGTWTSCEQSPGRDPCSINPQAPRRSGERHSAGYDDIRDNSIHIRTEDSTRKQALAIISFVRDAGDWAGRVVLQMKIQLGRRLASSFTGTRR
uniref:Uncharacterized protein n=1 Tax=Branchiostoma floridae TaxID=7739 RepID=C3ZTW6_BRAFL|eukprot:XP_002587997.1 hypothetical protein BRAFLDRAFT_88980 [Branchiostoma floridae]